MEMPKSSEHHRKLHALTGEWTGAEKFFATPFAPHGGSATSRTTARMDLDGFFLISDHAQTRDGKISFRGHGVFGYDPRQQKHTLHWFDVMGGDPGAPAIGTWEGNTLTLYHKHHMGQTRYTYTLERDGRYIFKLDFSQDGKSWMPFLEGTYTRVSS